MDFCPECGVAVEVQNQGDKIVYICRNPQCAFNGKNLVEGENLNG